MEHIKPFIIQNPAEHSKTSESAIGNYIETIHIYPSTRIQERKHKTWGM